MTFSRRSFFALAAASAMKSRTLLAQDKTGMNVLSKRPEDLEMPLSARRLHHARSSILRPHARLRADRQIARLALERRGEVATASLPHHGRA